MVTNRCIYISIHTAHIPTYITYTLREYKYIYEHIVEKRAIAQTYIYIHIRVPTNNNNNNKNIYMPFLNTHARLNAKQSLGRTYTRWGYTMRIPSAYK